MKTEDWKARWEAGQIGFHLERPHPQLVRFADRWRPEKAGRVFVPLCGKSLDLLWLRDRGHEVVGVEVSEIAVRAFFTENRLEPVAGALGGMDVRRSDRVAILRGDFFALDPGVIGPFPLIFDRAALIAISPGDRRRYVEHLLRFLAPGGRILLVALAYDPARMAGPPFAVPESEIHALFSGACTIEKLAEADALDDHFRGRGLASLTETVHLLTRRQPILGP